MTGEEREYLAAEIADELEDSAYGISTDEDRHKTGRLVTFRIEWELRQMGWMPPDTYDRLHDWMTRTGNIPDKHLNRDTLTAHLAELSGILHGR